MPTPCERHHQLVNKAVRSCRECQEASLTADEVKTREAEVARFFAEKPLRKEEESMIDRAQKQFAEYDTNKDGKIERDELLAVLTNGDDGLELSIANRWVDKFFQKHGVSPDGSVSYATFLKTLKKKPPRKHAEPSHGNLGADVSKLKDYYETKIDPATPGEINREQLQDALQSIGLITEDCITYTDDLFELFKAGNDPESTVSFQHFLDNFIRMQVFRAVYLIQDDKGWEWADTDNDGLIDQQEFERVFSHFVGPGTASEYCMTLFADIDDNNDGKLSQEELYKWYFAAVNKPSMEAIVAERAKHQQRPSPLPDPNP